MALQSTGCWVCGALLAVAAVGENAQAASALARGADGDVRVSRQAGTGELRFVRAVDLAPAVRGNRFRAYIAANAAHYGLRDPAAELQLAGSRTAAGGLRTETWLQRHRGVPVFGAMLRANYAVDGRLTTVNGAVVDGIDVDVEPSIDAAAAEAVALAEVAKTAPVGAGELRVDRALTKLYVYQIGLDRGVDGPIHLVHAVEVGDGRAIAERVFVDAHSGRVVDRLSRVHDIDRIVYDFSPFPSNVLWAEGQAFPTGLAGVDEAVVYSQDTYNFFASLSGETFLSWDGEDGPMEVVLNPAGPVLQCPGNASWISSRQVTTFCPGMTTDDIVAHEWAHGYTAATHDLIYRWQPGALNEAYSDIWGEAIDLLNGDGTDSSGGPRPAGQCSTSPGDSVRWLLGEDSTALGGAVRDMWQPDCFGDPAKVTDASYDCDPTLFDAGGVHTNSGVVNHAFALLVDGGSFNGQAVPAIGLDRAAAIYWRAQIAYHVPSTDFAAHADLLEAACEDLIGLDIFVPSAASPQAAVSSQVVDAAHCASVAAAAAAVELRTAPTQCGHAPFFDPDPPPLCAAGRVQRALLSQDFEAGLGAFSAGRREVANPEVFKRSDWRVETVLPQGRGGSAAFVDGAPPTSGGGCGPASGHSGVLYLQTPAVELPADSSGAAVAFRHAVGTPGPSDGANVKVSVNGGVWTPLGPRALRFNGYNGVIAPTPVDGINPLSGEDGYVGSAAGAVVSEWGETRLQVDTLARPGDTVALRFEYGASSCSGLAGWYVDDVAVYDCPPAVDSDGDGVDDSADNCIAAANPDQRDTDVDGFGNRCDPDIARPNDCQVNVSDIGPMVVAFFSAQDDPAWNEDADLDGDGDVDFTDLAVLRGMAFGAPGPSALAACP